MVYRYNKLSSMRIPESLKYERAKLIYQYRKQQGMTLEQIGKIFGLTKERVRQIIEDYEKNLKKVEAGLDK